MGGGGRGRGRGGRERRGEGEERERERERERGEEGRKEKKVSGKTKYRVTYLHTVHTCMYTCTK